MLQDSDDEGIFDASEDIESEINETISFTKARIVIFLLSLIYFWIYAQFFFKL